MDGNDKNVARLALSSPCALVFPGWEGGREGGAGQKREWVKNLYKGASSYVRNDCSISFVPHRKKRKDHFEDAQAPCRLRVLLARLGKFLNEENEQEDNAQCLATDGSNECPGGRSAGRPSDRSTNRASQRATGDQPGVHG